MADKWDRKYPLYIYINPLPNRHFIMVPLKDYGFFVFFWTNGGKQIWVKKTMNLEFKSRHKILTLELLFLHGDNLESYKFIDEFLLDFC